MLKRTGLLSVVIFSALICGGCQQFHPLGDFGQRLIDITTGHTPRNAAVKMMDQYFPDERRQGINELVERDFGRRAPYTDRYKEIARDDQDYLVRATAIRALNRSRNLESTPIFIHALDDKSDLVRLEAAKALVNMPDPNAAPVLARIVATPQENKDVRIAAADALKHYRNLEVARALVAQLGGKEFAIAWQAHRSLITITGKDLRYDESAWLNLLTGSGKPLG